MSPRLVLDEPYLGFIRLVAATLTQALGRARLREAEQRVNAIEREISETIQRSLLTPPPSTRDFQIAVRYQPAVEPGARLVLYTDGLVERRDESLEESQNRLVDAVTGRQNLSAEELCDALLARRPKSAGNDDIVVTVLQVNDTRR